jgi:lipopolysaccharide export system protein LptA
MICRAQRRAVTGRALLALLPLLLSLPSAAQNLDMTQGGPIEITSEDGIEWRQQEQVVIARGAARAVREGVAVDADRLIARYRPRWRSRAGAATRQRHQPRLRQRDLAA